MKAYIIALTDFNYSITHARSMQEKLLSYGINASIFPAIEGDIAALEFIKENRLPDSEFAHKNYKGILHYDFLSYTGIKGAFASHYKCWEICANLHEPIFIFEDDVIFTKSYIHFDFNDVLLVSIDKQFIKKWYLDYKFLLKHSENDYTVDYIGEHIPSASGYLIKPHAAQKLLERYKNTYDSPDHCIHSGLLDIKVLRNPIGYALNETHNKISATKDFEFAKSFKMQPNITY